MQAIPRSDKSISREYLDDHRMTCLKTPVLLLIFNRPEHARMVLARIREAKPTVLYIAADGPRNGKPKEEELCARARAIVSEIDWLCEVKTLFRDENMGCRSAVSTALDWFFEREPEGIVLEDDCMPHPTFFRFASELLERYRHDDRVMCITGNNFQPSMGEYPYSYYYSIFNHCWGWASWARAWKHFHTAGSELDNKELLRWMSEQYPRNVFRDVWLRNFRGARDGEIDTWDYSWTLACWTRGGLTCTPSRNLVSNIGFGEGATHTTDSQNFMASMPAYEMSWPLKHPNQVTRSPKFDEFVTTHCFGLKPPPAVSFYNRVRMGLRRRMSSIATRVRGTLGV
jgi:hypothetical protein